MIYKVRYYGDPVLRRRATPVKVFGDKLQKLGEDMLETMYDAPGIGLAAIQIGVPKRVIVMDLAGPDEEKAPRYFVNPEILWASEDTAPYRDTYLAPFAEAYGTTVADLGPAADLAARLGWAVRAVNGHVAGDEASTQARLRMFVDGRA